MRLVFAGTPPFAARALEALVAAGHDIPLVLTQPDRPAGRGLKLTPSAVSQAAAAHGLSVAKPATLRDPAAQEIVRSAKADVMVVAAYGLILPQAVLDIPVGGCINIHASLLPRWRGAAPVQRAILAGDAETGICIMRMEAGLDTGPVLRASRIPIDARDTAGSLTGKLAELGATCIVEVLARLADWPPVPQAGEPSYAAKVAKPEAVIDWARSAVEIDRQVRAFDPAPGCETTLSGQSLKVWEAFPEAGAGPAGVVLSATPEEGLRVACGGGGVLRITRVQRPGGRRVAMSEFLRSSPVEPGAVLASRPAAAADHASP